MKGLTADDLITYRYDPNFEPPRALATQEHKGFDVKRGDVRKVEQNKEKDAYGPSKL